MDKRYIIKIVTSLVFILISLFIIGLFLYETLIPISADLEEDILSEEIEVEKPVIIETIPEIDIEKISINMSALHYKPNEYPNGKLHYGDYNWYLENEWNSGSDLDILARITMAEANTTSDECHRLVAQVVVNRVKSDRYPNDFRTVVYQHATAEDGSEIWQFTPAQYGSIENKPTKQSYDAARYILTLYEKGMFYKYDNLIAFESMPVTQFSGWCEWAIKVDNVDFYTIIEW